MKIQRLAATLSGGGGSSGADSPLNTVNDLVRYFREFILRDSGIDEEKRGAFTRFFYSNLSCEFESTKKAVNDECVRIY